MLLKDLVILYRFQRILYGMGWILRFIYRAVGAFSICGADVAPLENTVETGCNCLCDTGE